MIVGDGKRRALPHRLASPCERSATPAGFAHVGDEVQSELLAALGSKVEAETSAGGFSGAVLVAKDGQPIFARAVRAGRSASSNIANTLETAFASVSMNKMFTAVAILCSSWRPGKFNLDAPLGTYLRITRTRLWRRA